MVGWHHGLKGHVFELALGVGDGQGSLVCCSPWGHKESDTTEVSQGSIPGWETKIPQATWQSQKEIGQNQLQRFL